ncbi:MAG: hypothetical protein M3405_07150, partial [Acidobacteriota bacterium]|nr:hypothetical protein [Acidobacteriota bacterium]
SFEFSFINFTFFSGSHNVNFIGYFNIIFHLNYLSSFWGSLYNSPAKEITDVDVKKALSEAFDHYPPPSLQSVFKELGIKDNGYKYQQKFKWLCGRITRHYNTYRSRLAKGEEEAKVIIRNALVEIPPPTISDISRRLGISRERVRFLFPREYEKISDRSYKFIVQERQLKSAKLKNNIDQIVKELTEKKIYPSENLVKSKLNIGYSDSEFKKILRRARISYR